MGSKVSFWECWELCSKTRKVRLSDRKFILWAVENVIKFKEYLCQTITFLVAKSATYTSLVEDSTKPICEYIALTLDMSATFVCSGSRKYQSWSRISDHISKLTLTYALFKGVTRLLLVNTTWRSTYRSYIMAFILSLCWVVSSAGRPLTDNPTLLSISTLTELLASARSSYALSYPVKNISCISSHCFVTTGLHTRLLKCSLFQIHSFRRTLMKN